MKIRFFFCVRTTAAEGGKSMADAYDEMERLMKSMKRWRKAISLPLWKK